MTITPVLFESFLKCPTQCWLRARNEAPSGNPYAEWLQSQNEAYRASQIERLLAETSPDESVRSPGGSRGNEAPISAALLKTSKCRLAVAVVARAVLPVDRGGASSASPANPRESEPRGTRPSEVCTLESRLHAVERVPAEGRGKAAQFIPIRCIFFNKLTQDDKLLLAFDAFALAQALGRDIAVGKIIHGDLRYCVRSRRGNEAQTSAPQLSTLNSQPSTN